MSYQRAVVHLKNYERFVDQHQRRSERRSGDGCGREFPTSANIERTTIAFRPMLSASQICFPVLIDPIFVPFVHAILLLFDLEVARPPGNSRCVGSHRHSSSYINYQKSEDVVVLQGTTALTRTMSGQNVVYGTNYAAYTTGPTSTAGVVVPPVPGVVGGMMKTAKTVTQYAAPPNNHVVRRANKGAGRKGAKNGNAIPVVYQTYNQQPNICAQQPSSSVYSSLNGTTSSTTSIVGGAPPAGAGAHQPPQLPGGMTTTKNPGVATMLMGTTSTYASFSAGYQGGHQGQAVGGAVGAAGGGPLPSSSAYWYNSSWANADEEPQQEEEEESAPPAPLDLAEFEEDYSVQIGCTRVALESMSAEAFRTTTRALTARIASGEIPMAKIREYAKVGPS